MSDRRTPDDAPDQPSYPLPDPATIGSEHPDVTGGWLRPAVFGASDGLVSNFALIMGMAGGTTDPKPVILAGFAGLAAGAFSMAVGEYTSVASQAEFARAEVERESREIARHDRAEQAELASMFVAKGVDEDVAREVAQQIHSDPENAVRVHAREEFGVDLTDLPSPMLAAGSSFLSFAVGAIIPLVPLLFGIVSVVPTVTVSLLALFGVGAVVTAITDRPWWFGGLRQLILGGAAAGLTFLVGSLVGGVAV
ncbi:VIT1/CCC1 transporter family protein [Mumia sp. zg.B53]|uniref:VIT1/CCC1 transporter family protein n=1 Tax=unclassified Mumia TaxID=2621872 RepID=UPI001C6DDE8F|nr:MULTISPECIES: VIT1/CCC1 transporter family protein [unclassified Mumia]MBW9206197.1 VIT1/CCC1 transporter family protein [Mumia sp. zg.B17]MBW9211509.1 VIT1/CCC1 transporter family protein [Mumia sp. zg.B21]MBW9216682.1 VIT1/CCC1 transporter family protein [Mumia sp. zg.B53]MDD9348285.1 VIT1/CCC1 transporter family protein [Mumia sp.]